MRFGGIWGRAVVITALVIVGACSEPEPKEPSAPVSSATPTTTAPTLPAQAEEDTPSGAANFANYFVATFNYAAQTGDVEPMLAVAPHCKPCKEYADDFVELKGTEGLSDQPVWALSDVSVSKSRSPLSVDATISIVDGSEDGPYKVTFVLNKTAPFEITDIFMREG